MERRKGQRLLRVEAGGTLEFGRPELAGVVGRTQRQTAALAEEVARRSVMGAGLAMDVEPEPLELGSGIELADSCLFAFTGGAQTSPNDLKLSDCGGRRGSCMVGGKAAAEAATVTPGAVRCSAWLGDVR